MAIESTGHSQGNPRLYELVEHTPKTGKSPTIWAWPEVIDFFRVAGQPVPGPWPPHQQPRPDPEEESEPVAVPDPQSAKDYGPTNQRPSEGRPSDQGPSDQGPSDQGPSDQSRAERGPADLGTVDKGSHAAPTTSPRHYLDEEADSDHQGRGYLDK